MASYLFVWNPKKWNWADFQDAIYRVNNGKSYVCGWSCGSTKKIVEGDRFYLLRLGVEPKGIIGVGSIVSSCYHLRHWDEEKAKQGKVALRNDLSFDCLSDDPIFSLAELNQKYPEVRWTPQSGGVLLNEEISLKLLEKCDIELVSKSSDDIKYIEGEKQIISIATYDRSAQARQECIKAWGYQCAVCGFDFGAVYGEYGKGYIEVHHLKPISEKDGEYEVSPIEDLRPVCANCHRMLHKSKQTLSIEELKLKLL